MTRHSDLPNDQLHEPKGLANAVVGDAGKVLTPSDTIDGVSQLRQLSETEIKDVVDYYTLEVPDISTASSTGYVMIPIVSPYTDGEIVSVSAAIDTAVTGTAVLSFSLDDGAGAWRTAMTQTMSLAAPTILTPTTVTPTDNNDLFTSSTDGATLRVVSDGGSTTASKAYVTVGVKRTNV